MKSLIAALLLTASASAETIIIPVQELIFEVPNYRNTSRFSLSPMPTEIDRNRSDRPRTRRELEAQLIDMMWDEYPDAESIRIRNGNMIVRMP